MYYYFYILIVWIWFLFYSFYVCRFWLCWYILFFKVLNGVFFVKIFSYIFFGKKFELCWYIFWRFGSKEFKKIMVIWFEVVEYDVCVLFELIFFYYVDCGYGFVILDKIKLIFSYFG